MPSGPRTGGNLRIIVLFWMVFSGSQEPVRHGATRPKNSASGPWSAAGSAAGRAQGCGRTSWTRLLAVRERGPTRIHLRVNGACLPMRTEITPGQVSDCAGCDLGMAGNLPQPAVLVADRGHGADKIRSDIERRNALPMIPMRKNRRLRKAVDMTTPPQRTMVERGFNTLKNSRRRATCYDKTAESVLGFVDVACIRLWLRHLST